MDNFWRQVIAGAISLFLNIAGAIAPLAPVLNTPLHGMTTVFKEHQLKSPLSDTDSGPLRYVCNLILW